MSHSCFVLMPINKDNFDEYYKDIIKPTVTNMDFKVSRADEIYGTKAVMDDILAGINDSDIIIADVTGKNPNVLYELGIAHTLNKAVLILTQNVDDIPFDFKHIRVISYDPSEFNYADKLSNAIRLTINSILNNKLDYLQKLPNFYNIQIPNQNGYWKSIVINSYNTKYSKFYELLGLIPLSSISNAKSYFYNESHWIKLKNNSKIIIKDNDFVKFKFNTISNILFLDHYGKAVIARNIEINNDNDISILNE